MGARMGGWEGGNEGGRGERERETDRQRDRQTELIGVRELIGEREGERGLIGGERES